MGDVGVGDGWWVTENEPWVVMVGGWVGGWVMVDG